VTDAVLRRQRYSITLDPPYRSVFNYLVSYELETDAIVRYPMKLQQIPVRQIAAVAQDPCGDAGFAGVPKAVRALSAGESAIVWFNDKRNTLKAQAAPIEGLRFQTIGPPPSSSKRNATRLPE